MEEQSFNRIPCDDPTDNGPRGRVSVGKRYWMRGVATSFQHDFAISATSPCVWPEGTTPPT